MHRPFECLASLLESKDLPDRVQPQLPSPKEGIEKEGFEKEGFDDDEGFRLWMQDVVPLEREGPDEEQASRSPLAVGEHTDPDAEARAALYELVRGGEGFVISQTSEYFEGTGYGVHPQVARSLHEGRFSIQAHIDLHGLGVRKAGEVFDAFLREAVLSGKRAVLVVHGRGLSSRDLPVLKHQVLLWLTRGFWRKWVIAFSSARWCDGGAGATYVLLRTRPVTRSRRRKQGRGGLQGRKGS